MSMGMGTHMLRMGGGDGRGYDEQQLRERLQTGSDESRDDEDDGDVMQGELQEAL